MEVKMKKLFISMIILGFFIGIFSNEITLIAEVYLGEPIIHVVQEGESISKISKKYYDNAFYWRELALINMAPNPDLIIAGEEILIPSLDIIQQLNKAKTISTVKNLVISKHLAVKESERNNTDLAEKKSSAPQKRLNQPTDTGVKANPSIRKSPEPRGAAMNTKKAGGFPWIWFIALVLLMGGAVGLYLYRRRQLQIAVEYGATTDSGKIPPENKSKSDRMNISDISPEFSWIKPEYEEGSTDRRTKERQKEAVVED
jgi:hypothetical protein